MRHITLIDNGRVAYSNPVRQSLYAFENCANGGQIKAECAANALRQIFPGMSCRGIDMRIPMPGHYVADAEEVEKDVKQLLDAIDQHDVVFLLTDTRESRWLPTMLSAYRGKVEKLEFPFIKTDFQEIFVVFDCCWRLVGYQCRFGLRYVPGDASRTKRTVESGPNGSGKIERRHAGSPARSPAGLLFLQ